MQLGFLASHLHDASWPATALGLVVLLVGAAINLHSDHVLRSLRQDIKDTAHYVPHGGLFDFVTCPHYFGEWMEWVGFCMLARTISSAVFAWWTLANLLPRARAYQSWYRYV